MTEQAVTGRVLGIPELSLVVLIGVSGSGKSTFARQHFGRFEVISSDFCRGLVADDENDQAATADAFDVLHYIAGKRLAAGRLTVIDATNVQAADRRQLVELARAHDVLPVAIVLDVAEKTCALQRNAGPSGPVVRRTCRAASARPAAPVPALARPGGVPPGARAARGRRGRRGGHRAATGCSTTTATAPARST